LKQVQVLGRTLTWRAGPSC